jgi:O-methyltransferase involved in polyketide biosynthesis
MNANSPLAATACWTAAVRARESRGEDRLFHDPWADYFLTVVFTARAAAIFLAKQEAALAVMFLVFK